MNVTEQREEYTLEEVAKILGIYPSAVAILIHRGELKRARGSQYVTSAQLKAYVDILEAERQNDATSFVEESQQHCVSNVDAELVHKGDDVLSTLDELSELREEITECSKFKNVWQLTEVGLTLRGVDFVLQYDELGDMIQTLVREPKTQALRPATEAEELSLTIAIGKLCKAG